MPLTVGTAGHIDHGKTSLVEALTGKNTDRLPEEHARGISIDLGYAPLELPDGTQLSVVDVPGHERFVRTMVAGASGIDLFLLVVDAREGARPQTHEHLAILRLLGIDRGVVALTKADLVDADTLELARLEVEELLPGVPLVVTSARTGAGLEELRAALAEVAAGIEQHAADGPVRLHVDRSFSLRGIGTVVTGTLWSGTIGEGDELRVEPHGRDGARAQRAGARPGGRARRRGPARRGLAARESSDTRSVAATCSSRPVRFARASGSTSHSTAPATSRLASSSTTAPPRRSHASPAPGSGSRSFGSPGRSLRRVATGSCCGRRRPSAAEPSSTPHRHGTPTSRGSRQPSAASSSSTLRPSSTASGAGRRSGSTSSTPS